MVSRLCTGRLQVSFRLLVSFSEWAWLKFAEGLLRDGVFDCSKLSSKPRPLPFMYFPFSQSAIMTYSQLEGNSNAGMLVRWLLI